MGGHWGGHWEATVEATGRPLGGHYSRLSTCEFPFTLAVGRYLTFTCSSSTYLQVRLQYGKRNRHPQNWSETHTYTQKFILKRDDTDAHLTGHWHATQKDSCKAEQIQSDYHLQQAPLRYFTAFARTFLFAQSCWA